MDDVEDIDIDRHFLGPGFRKGCFSLSTEVRMMMERTSIVKKPSLCKVFTKATKRNGIGNVAKRKLK
jgi:hypothetical protein